MNGKRLTAMMLAALLGTVAPQTAFAGWQEGNPLIAHALGRADGKIELNSKEAFEQSWGNGYQALEADFAYTSDGVLVLRHDFDAEGAYYRLEQKPDGPLVMDSTTFQNSKIVYEQTPLTAADLLSLMAEYPDVYVITDTKETERETVQKQFTDLKTIATNMGAPELLNRFVPQIYNQEMYGWVKAVYPFPEWIYTLYLDTNPNYPKIAEFCAGNGIGTVTVHKDRVTKAVVDTMHAKNVKVYAHTVNRYEQMKSLLALGVDGVYTDTIQPYELSWVGLSPSRKTTEKTVTVDGKEVKLTTISLLKEGYVPLRQMAVLGKGFSANFDAEKDLLSLTSGKTFTTLGNELLLDSRGRLIAEKAAFSVLYDGKTTKIMPILVDGEVYVNYEEMAKIMGITP